MFCICHRQRDLRRSCGDLKVVNAKKLDILLWLPCTGDSKRSACEFCISKLLTKLPSFQIGAEIVSDHAYDLHSRMLCVTAHFRGHAGPSSSPGLVIPSPEHSRPILRTTPKSTRRTLWTRSSEMSGPSAKTLFDLPAELRNDIYELVIPTNVNIMLNNQYGEMQPARLPALCLSSRQLRSETLALWRSTNCFTVLTNTQKKVEVWLDS